MNNVLLSSLLILSAILLSNLVIYGIRKRTVPGVFFFSVLMMAMVIHSVGYAFELIGNSLEHMYFCVRIEYIGGSFYPFLIMLFAREYTDEKKFANKYLLTLILTINIATLIFVNTNSIHGLYYSSVSIDSSPGFNILVLKRGIWYFVQLIALYFSIFYNVIIFSIKLKRTRGDYRKKVALMLIGALIPVFTSIIYTFGLGPIYIDLSPFSYLFMSLFVSAALIRYDILFLAPITHEMVFNSIEQAVLVVDKNGLIVNFNATSKRFFPSISKIKIGDPIYLINELKGYNFASNQQIYEVNDKIFNFKIIDIKNNKVSIYVVHDITESERVKKQLEILATEDALTGLYNRRYFMEKIESSIKEGVLVIIDLDYFKVINDTFGHIEGDKVLNCFGVELKKLFSKQLACRYGGEEFAVFIKEVNVHEAYIQLEALREKINCMGRDIKFTFSAGIAEYKKGHVSEALINADKKLYEAKESGRNQTRY